MGEWMDRAASVSDRLQDLIDQLDACIAKDDYTGSVFAPPQFSPEILDLAMMLPWSTLASNPNITAQRFMSEQQLRLERERHERRMMITAAYFFNDAPCIKCGKPAREMRSQFTFETWDAARKHEATRKCGVCGYKHRLRPRAVAVYDLERRMA